MFLLFLKEYWKYLAIFGIVVCIYYAIYNIGYNSCKKDWDKAILERNRIQQEQTLAIVKLSEKVSESSETATKQSSSNLAKILLSVKNKPLYKITDGKCAPSSEFETTYSDLVKEGNKHN